MDKYIKQIAAFFILVSAIFPIVYLHAEDQALTRFHFSARRDNPGFFSLFNSIIGALDYCEQQNGYLTIDFEDNGWYYDEHHGPNWWEYYFESPYDEQNKNDSGQCIKLKAWQKIAFTLEAQFQMPRDRAHALIKKYINIKPHITKKIDIFYYEHMKNFHVIGVHYRGTDKHLEAPKVSYEKMFEIVHREFLSHSIMRPTKIFVATDDQRFMQFMKERYGHFVCGINAMRSVDHKAVHVEKKGSNYKKGEDALIDCVLLSKCDLLIKMSSNLSDTSQMFNPKMQVIHANIGYDE